MAIVEPTKLAQATVLLCELGDHAVAAQQALAITVAMLALARGYDIGRDASGFFARPRKSAAAPARLLRDIEVMARKAIDKKIDVEQWIDEWEALPQAVQQVWKRVLVITKDGPTLDGTTILGYQSPHRTVIVPKPEIAHPVILAAIARRKTEGVSKVRRCGEPEHAAIQTVQTAYQTLTGKSGRRTVRDGRRTGPYHRFCLEIDQIFETTLFSKRDGGRDR